MKNIFEQLGYNVTKIKFSMLSEEKQFFYIPNEDGSIRCMWPADISEPLFLEHSKIGHLLSKQYVTFIKLVYSLGIQSTVFEKTTMYVVKNKHKENDFDINSNWTLFNESNGKDSKALVFTEDEGKLRFTKIYLN